MSDESLRNFGTVAVGMSFICIIYALAYSLWFKLHPFFSLIAILSGSFLLVIIIKRLFL